MPVASHPVFDRTLWLADGNKAAEGLDRAGNTLERKPLAYVAPNFRQ